MTPTTTSLDGTPIAYDVLGQDDAPAVIWVHGATGFRALQPAARRFAEISGLRVLTYDRRGRGESGDTAPYAPKREIEDIEALVDVLGGGVAVIIGESSGALLALEAARAGVAANGVIAYEPSLIIDGSRPPLPGDYVEQRDSLTAARDYEGAHRLFLTAAVGLPSDFVDGIVQAPFWPMLEPVAPTIAYDGRIARDYMTGSPEALTRFAEITVPVLVGAGDQTAPFLIDGARALVTQLRDGRLELIPGGSHQTDPELVSDVFASFVKSVA